MTTLIALILLCVGQSVAQLRSDFDGDGNVNFADFLAFAESYGTNTAVFDLDASGTVDFPDFLLFSADYAGSDRSPHWIRRDSATRPPGRRDHSLTLDPLRRQVLLFGGKRDAVLDDTWILDLETWSWRQIRRSRIPAGRRGHTAIHDPDRDRVLIYGGETDSGFLSDVWAFDLASETWSFIVVPGSKPVPRYGLGAVLDTRRDRMLISHGFSSDGRFDDTWALDLSEHTWSELETTGAAPPQARCLHDVVLKESEDALYLWGGCSSGIGPCPRGDLWVLTLADQRWTEIVQRTARPTDRTNLRLELDPQTGEIILLAGSDVRGTRDVWAFDAESASWSEHSPTGEAPDVRWSHEIVYDSAQHRIVMFGGTDGAVWHNDLWELRF